MTSKGDDMNDTPTHKDLGSPLSPEVSRAHEAANHKTECEYVAQGYRCSCGATLDAYYDGAEALDSNGKD